MKRVFIWGIALAAGTFALAASAATYDAKDCSTPLVLKGDQSGNTIRVAAGFLPARWSAATAIYAQGKPKFSLPPDLRVRADGDNWWEVYRKEEPRVFVWTGHGGNAKWGNVRNWSPMGVPDRLDSVKFTEEAKIDLGRDRMVSNIFFSATVILGGAKVHAQNTIGRGSKARLGARANSLLGKVSLSDGAKVQPLRGTAGYKGLLEEDARKGVSRIIETRPSAKYVWTGAAKDGKWTNVKNWQANGRAAVESPVEVDSVVIGKDGSKEKLEIELPWGLTVVSNLVMHSTVTWRRERKGTEVLEGEDAAEVNAALPCLDVLDLSGNKDFTVRGEVQFCVKGEKSTAVALVAEKGTRLALAAHNHVPYKSVTIESGATLLPYDWVVEIERLELKSGHLIQYWPPRIFNRWRPLWVIHAKNLQGEPKLSEHGGWGFRTERLQDGSHAIMIQFK